ncbi:alpha/beta hydrolase family protein [Aeromonas sp. 3P]|uniref:alpha/beta hydrolase family protein n=1 Tax=Aeromonas sp. 3P TaxID=3452719 RepID=UPI003F796399
MKEFQTTEVDSILHIPTSQEEPVIYKLKINDSLYLSGLYRVNKETDKLVVFFNGAINGDLTDRPNFMRWSWAYENNLSFVCFDDPIVSCTQSTNLGWYIGSSECDIQEYIYMITNHLVKSLCIEPNRVIFYGSSGGGFAALMAAIRLRGSVAVVNNPQTNIFKYYKSAANRLTDNFFKNEKISSDSDIYHRFSVLHAIKKYDYIPAVLYVQNIQDRFHLERHLIPFQTSTLQILSSVGDYPNKIYFHFFNDNRGHSVFSDKKEFISEINQAVTLSKATKVYPSLFNLKKSNYLNENIIWYELQDNTISVDVSFELNFEPSPDNSRPAIFLVDTDKIGFHELKKHGYSYSKSLKCAFKYIDNLHPGKKITIEVHKELAAKRIGLRKWKCVGELHFKNLEVKNRND